MKAVLRGTLRFIFKNEIVAAIWVRAFGGWWAERARHRLGKLAGKRFPNDRDD